MASTEGLRYRPLEKEDVPAACGLNAEAGWNQIADDWLHMLSFGSGTAVDDAEGRLVATSMVLPYGEDFAWIAMILVTQSQRRRGIATELMRRAIARCREDGRIAGLDATEAGRPVYLPLGFSDVYGLSRWTAPGAPALAGATPATEEIAARDLPRVSEFDAKVFGADRGSYLRHLRARCPELALMVRQGSGIVGFVMARDGRVATQIGPLIATDERAARALLAGALARVRGPVYFDAADHHDGFRDLIAASGFERQRGYVRMLLERSQPLDDPSRVYIISGPEFG